MPKQVLNVTVNGESHELLVQPYQTLLETLREDLSLTGTKEGCGTGDCGCCTVVLDGRPITSCLVLALQAEGSPIRTSEGLGDGERLDPIQEAFVRHGAKGVGEPPIVPGPAAIANAVRDATGQAFTDLPITPDKVVAALAQGSSGRR